MPEQGAWRFRPWGWRPRAGRPSPSPRLLLAAWLVIVAQVLLAGGFLLAGPSSRQAGRADPDPQGRSVAGIFDGSAPSGRGIDRAARTERVRALLAQRAKAILERDRTAFLGTIAPAAAQLRQRQAGFFDAIAAVPIGSWAYRLDPHRAAPLPPGVFAAYGDAVWAPRVELRYQLAGYDEAPTSQPQKFRFVRHGQRWYLADDGLGGAGTQADPSGPETVGGTVRNLWDFGPVTVLRAPGVLVLGHPGSEKLMRSAYQIAQRAIPAVTAVWGTQWRRRVVVLVPDTAAELGQIVEETGDLSQLAAFTSADVRRAGPPTGKRVVINPTAFGKLSPYGRRVVLTHEITHVATRQVTSSAMPYWLAEGFADYVAYRGTGVPVRRAARELAQDLRSGRLPDRLPELSDFEAGSPRLAQAYQEAWLACRLIAERGGEATLVRLYRRLSRAPGDPRALDAALHDELGMGTAEFVAAWRRYLDRQVGDE